MYTPPRTFAPIDIPLRVFYIKVDLITLVRSSISLYTYSLFTSYITFPEFFPLYTVLIPTRAKPQENRTLLALISAYALTVRIHSLSPRHPFLAIGMYNALMQTVYQHTDDTHYSYLANADTYLIVSSYWSFKQVCAARYTPYEYRRRRYYRINSRSIIYDNPFDSLVLRN